MILLTIIISSAFGIGLALYLGRKDEALLDYAEPFEEG